MRPPTAHCALEFFRWVVRSLPRPDGRRRRRARGVRSHAVLQIHGRADACTLPSTALGSEKYLTGEYEWCLLDGIGHFPQEEAPGEVSKHLVRWAALD
jgi:pimeloyl-ACP methyl ester carboxylesterase